MNTKRPLIATLALVFLVPLTARGELLVTIDEYNQPPPNNYVGIVTLSVTGTVDELGTTLNNNIYIGQEGVEWTLVGPLNDGVNRFGYTQSPESVYDYGSQHGGNSGTGDYFHGRPDPVLPNSPMFNPIPGEHYFELEFDQDFQVGDSVDFTFSAVVGIEAAQYGAVFSLLTAPTARVGVGELPAAAATVPEPGSLALGVLGALGLGVVTRRRKHRAAGADTTPT